MIFRKFKNRKIMSYRSSREMLPTPEKTREEFKREQVKQIRLRMNNVHQS